MFTRREPYHSETEVLAVVRGGPDNGVGLGLAEKVSGGGAISAKHKYSHSRRLSARASARDAATRRRHW